MTSSSTKQEFISLNDGTSIPIIGLGTWQSSPGQVRAAVYSAIECGYRHVDCAPSYRNEDEVGEAIKDAINAGIIKREQLFVTNKCWLTFYSNARVEKCCRRSLSKLKLDYFDLYLIHWPIGLKNDDDEFYPKGSDGKVIFADVDFTDTWKGMERCKELGLVKSIGVSNFNSAQIERLLSVAKIKPVINQVECHPYLNQQKLFDFCVKRGIVLTAYSPLGSTPPQTSGHNGCVNDRPVLLEDEKVKEIAKRYNKSVAQVLIRYQIQRHIIVIPKSVNKHRIEENFKVFDFEISKEDMTALNNLNRNFRFVTFDRFGLSLHKDYPFQIEY